MSEVPCTDVRGSLHSWRVAAGGEGFLERDDPLVKLVVLARTDLAMSRGKIAAQVAHAAVLAALNGLGTPDFATWLEQGQPKVVLKVGDANELRRLAEAVKQAGLPISLVADAGRTQLPPGTLTCAAIGPAEDRRIDAITGDLPLL
jgi:peptidyl-tRNA hydrolase, PTH2 family